MYKVFLLSMFLSACSGDENERQKNVQEATTLPPNSPTEAAAIDIVVQDLQIFHPFSRSRALMNATGGPKLDTTRSRDSFGIGLVIDATNLSPHLLAKPDLVGWFELAGAHGTTRCELTPKRYGRGRGSNHLSLDPRSKGQWLDETKQRYERAWRPGETIRLAARKDCGSFYLLDAALEKIQLSYTVTAEALLHPKRREATFPLPDPDALLAKSAEQRFELSADAAILQRSRFNDQPAHVAGDVVIQWLNHKIVRRDLGAMGVRADQLERIAVPNVFSPVSQAIHELMFSIKSVQLRHWTDLEATGKGRRELAVEAVVSMDEPALTDRIGATFSQSTDAAKAKGIAAERARLTKLIPCQNILLVTTARALVSTNPRATMESCAQLSESNELILNINYNISRYEVPVGIQFIMGSTPYFLPIDHQGLLRFDPR